MSLFSFVAAIASGCFGIFDRSLDVAGKVFSAILAFMFAVCSLGLLLPGRTVLNVSKRTLTREILLFARYRVYSSERPFADFKSIRLERRVGGTEADYWVGLMPLKGRTLWISYFSNIPISSPGSQAETLAEQLSSDFKLPVKKDY
ncbi:MAG TPA: hypothetical protein VN048_10770 [Verrucomicrobiae bacterium]|nr:hypothetical protein [Verrucomicrobiae bacterium]